MGSRNCQPWFEPHWNFPSVWRKKIREKAKRKIGSGEKKQRSKPIHTIIPIPSNGPLTLSTYLVDIDC